MTITGTNGKPFWNRKTHSEKQAQEQVLSRVKQLPQTAHLGRVGKELEDTPECGSQNHPHLPTCQSAAHTCGRGSQCWNKIPLPDHLVSLHDMVMRWQAIFDSHRKIFCGSLLKRKILTHVSLESWKTFAFESIQTPVFKYFVFFPFTLNCSLRVEPIRAFTNVGEMARLFNKHSYVEVVSQNSP